jgi:hypothetical protein
VDRLRGQLESLQMQFSITLDRMETRLGDEILRADRACALRDNAMLQR